MNKKHEPLSSRTAKQEKKEVKKGLKEAAIEPSSKATPLSKQEKTSAKRKGKTDLTPSHANQEGSRWADILQKQMLENQRRMQGK